MKIRKIYESIKLDTAEKISEMFFEKYGNFGSEELIIKQFPEDKQLKSIEMIFYFPAIESEEFDQISKCKEYVSPYYMDFYLNSKDNDLLLHIELTLYQQKMLDEKLDLERTRNKFNL